ncbi:DUF6314 family protein [Jannaschia sp. LMIT008]|uniref:DUF6314 family protein n=1 Tax=Jannaschia maritima TaxID=3032585 RepID=UPI00281219D1|nr:DUF6314 family protein [Jannaschia sp. LMIT008]
MTGTDTSTRLHLRRLVGAWQVVRRIRHDDGAIASFDGICRWAWSDGALQAREVGLLTTGRVKVKAHRVTWWRTLGDMVQVTFENGRPFHLIAPEPMPSATHNCMPDTYQIAYDFREWPTWTCRWRVDGPAKAYAATTTYRRF